MSWAKARELLAEHLEPLGFEVLGAVASDEYNDALEAQHAAYRITALGEPSVALVIGNTRRLWPLFLDAFANSAIGDELHPLDAYSRQHIGGAAAEVARALGVQHVVRFSFDPPPNTVAIQKLATLAGVAELAPIGLCIHPTFGPWLSLRAAVVLAMPGPRATQSAATCSGCTRRPCLGPREQVVAMGGAGVTRELLATHWQTWLAMRDACPIGRESRYGDPQIRYHYLKERSVLRAESKR